MKNGSTEKHLASSFLVTLLTVSFLFCVSAQSAPLCADLLQEASLASGTAYEKLPTEAKIFWKDIGAALATHLDYDFQRFGNKKIYSEHVKMNHPSVKFYKSLGFTVTPENHFKTPSGEVLFSNLTAQIATLNHQLKESGSNIQIEPKIFLDLADSTKHLQKVVLNPLQFFSAPGTQLVPKSNLLKTEPFYQFVARGNFPIGGVESAVGLPRSYIELEQQIPDGVKLYGNSLSLSDFLHDLGHLSAFMRNPEFAKAYVKVFRSQVLKMEKMDPEQKKSFLRELERQGSPEWRRNFYFSESAWTIKNTYHSTLEKWPVLSSLMKGHKSLSSNDLVEMIRQIDQDALFEELKDLKSNWWNLFDPLGGGVNDMISHDAAEPHVRSNFIVQKVLNDLEIYVRSKSSLYYPQQNSLAIILGFVKNAPRMMVPHWEYFGRSDHWRDSEIMNALKDIFPEREMIYLKEWNNLYNFLYKNED